jgi:hypothetical protein
MCFLSFTEPMINCASSAETKTKDQTSPLATLKTLKPSFGQNHKPPSQVASSLESQGSTRAVSMSPRQKAFTGPKSKPLKGKLSVKAQKKVAPKAVVQPRMDLAHYGILEDSRRYDPRPPADSAAVRSPQTPELAHDHFQELDRNQDGVIDPVERAFGRIDMDRDLSNRQFR